MGNMELVMTDATFEQACLDDYLRMSTPNGDQPSSGVGWVTHRGEDLAVLRNCNGVIAGYRAVIRGEYWTGDVQPVGDVRILRARRDGLVRPAGRSPWFSSPTP